MKKIFQSVLTLSLIAFLAISYKTTSAVDEAKNEKLANSLLWKITGKGIQKPSYLFGTVHMTCNYNLSDKLKKAFDETSQVALEIDMDDPNMQVKVMQGMLMKDNKSIKNMLSSEDYTKLDNYFKKNVGMGVAMFNKAKPFMLMSMLLTKSASCKTPIAYETEFVKIAKTQKEEVVGLETIESQMALFDEIPYKVQLKEVMKIVNDTEGKTQKQFAELSNLHTAENIEGLLKLMQEEEGMAKDFSDKLLDARNKNWIPVIEKMAKGQPTFFGVGAMHLAGENGVVKLLRKAGYTVTAVK